MNFLNIDGFPINLKNSIYLDALRRRDDSLINQAIKDHLIWEYAQKNHIIVTDKQLQEAFNETRHLMKLEDINDFNNKLKELNISLLSLQNFIKTILIENKIISLISEREVKEYYDEHKLEYEKVELYSIRVETEAKAKKIKKMVIEDNQNFLVLAYEHSKDIQSAKKGGFIGALARSQMTGEVESKVFNSSPGDLIGPVKTVKGYNLFKLEKIIKPTLKEMEPIIRRKLYDKLVLKLKNNAKIEF